MERLLRDFLCSAASLSGQEHSRNYHRSCPPRGDWTDALPPPFLAMLPLPMTCVSLIWVRGVFHLSDAYGPSDWSGPTSCTCSMGVSPLSSTASDFSIWPLAVQLMVATVQVVMADRNTPRTWLERSYLRHALVGFRNRVPELPCYHALTFSCWSLRS